MDGLEFTSRQLKTLRSKVFASTPPKGLPLAERLGQETMRALIVRDSNTRGLGGPTRADKAAEHGSNRYAKFLLDIGVANRAEIEGGTYGFGRSIAFNVSGVNTVIVYTRTSDELAAPESRLIAAALGDNYAHGGKRYTGRHWWGRTVRNSVEPVVGQRADALASEIGFRPFESDETGTALMILDPVLRTTDARRAMAFIAESMTWHLWPKMVSHNGRRPMRFSVSWNGTNIPVPDPGRLPPLPGYIRALEVLKDTIEPGVTADGVETIDIRAERPRAKLGRLAMSRFPFRNRRPSADLAEDDDDSLSMRAAPFDGNSSHVVLLRKPELVVTYQQYALLPDSNVEWAGVFLADPEYNEAFAAAEPPTHDAWEPAMIEDKLQRRVVNIALREIRKNVNNRHQLLTASPQAPDSHRSVARVANALGTLFSGIAGAGAAVTLGGGALPGNSGYPRRPKVTIERSGPVIDGDSRVSEVVFRLVPVPGRERTDVEVSVDVATGDGSTVEGDERPVGAPTPVLLRVEGPSRVEIPPSTARLVFPVEATGDTTWRVVATAPEDTVVAYTIEATPSASTDQSPPADQ